MQLHGTGNVERDDTSILKWIIDPTNITCIHVGKMLTPWELCKRSQTSSNIEPDWLPSTLQRQRITIKTWSAEFLCGT